MFRTLYLMHILNLIIHQTERKEENDKLIKVEATKGKINLSNVFELVEALNDSDQELAAPEIAHS